MAIINATGDAVSAMKKKFALAQHHGRIPRAKKPHIVCYRVGNDTAYELICLSSDRRKLPLRPVPFRRLITDTTPLPREVRHSRRSDRYVYVD